MRALEIIEGTYSRGNHIASCLVLCRVGLYRTRRKEVWVSKFDQEPEFYTGNGKIIEGVNDLLIEAGYVKRLSR